MHDYIKIFLPACGILNEINFTVHTYHNIREILKKSNILKIISKYKYYMTSPNTKDVFIFFYL